MNSSCCSQESSSPRDVTSLAEEAGGEMYRDETGLHPAAYQELNGPSYHVTHLSEKISRPAVKITGATHDSMVRSNPAADGSVPVPDRCRSSTSSSPSTTASCSHLDDIKPTPLSPV